MDPGDDRGDESPAPSAAATRPKDWPEGVPWEGSVADHDPGAHRGPVTVGDDQDEDEEGPEPRLRPRQHWALVGTTVGLWVAVMAILGVHWWDFERHGPWLTPLTPFVFAGALEGALIARRPELNRHHDPDEPLRRRRRAHELGERARPYWAREGRDRAPEEGEAPGNGPEARSPTGAGPPLSDRTRRSP